MEQNRNRKRNLTLIIKTPNRNQEDQTVERVPPDWTVLDLKGHLSTAHPSRPAVSEQRLIFAGKLLPDHLLMSDLFSPTDAVLSLHLVCSFRAPPSASAVADPPRSSARPSQDRSEARQRRSSSSSSSSSSAWPPAGRSSPVMSRPSVSPYWPYSVQQLLWLQHVYARHFYLQYHAALAAAGSAPTPPAATAAGLYPPVPAHQVAAPGTPLVNRNAVDDLPADQNAAPDGAFVNPAAAAAANPNLRMNAQGGPVVEDEEDGAERDWLDWTYSAARFGVLLAIVYFNSSLSRFLLVMSTLLLMFLHTAGWFPFRRRVQVQEPEQNQNQNQDVDPADGAQEDGSGGPGGPGGPGPLAAVLVPPHQVSLMWTAWVFFKTFFSSLIPDVPQGVAN